MLQTVLVVQCFARGTLRRTKVVDKSSELFGCFALVRGKVVLSS